MRRILTLTSLLLAATLITACGEDAEPSTITGADDTSDTVNDTCLLYTSPSPRDRG